MKSLWPDPELTLNMKGMWKLSNCDSAKGAH